MEEKTAKRSEQLTFSKKNVYEKADADRMAAIFAYAEGYKAFLDAAKTEREAVRRGIEMAEAAGFTAYELGDELKPGVCLFIYIFL